MEMMILTCLDRNLLVAWLQFQADCLMPIWAPAAPCAMPKVVILS